jgi:hypothetical protein
MKVDSRLKNLEVRVVTAVAAALVSGIAFVLSAPFSTNDYRLSDVATSEEKSTTTSTAPQEAPPAALEPALRSLDGVSYHG